MKLALVPLEQWEQLNLQLKEHFALPDSSSVRVYKGLAHAAFEVVQGTAQFLSHKRNLGVVKGQTPYFEPLLSSFYKDAYGIQSISHTELFSDETALQTWVDALKKDTSFVLFAEDHPVTGELYPVERLDEMLNEKKIFSIRISHFKHFYDKTSLRPFSVKLCALTLDLAIAICGERFKVPPTLAPHMNWNVDAEMTAVQKLDVPAEDRTLVESFEASVSDFATPFFSPADANSVAPVGSNVVSPTGSNVVAPAGANNRLYDRVVLKFNDISGEALLNALHTRLQLDPSLRYQTMDTTNLCRWNHYRTFSSWWEPKPSEESLEGLVIIDNGWLVTKDFHKILKQICEEIRAQQSW